ncbi:hypothetical protein BGM09_23500 [Streptomyces sp. CBMA29]|nr:hypothetical protein [Streptomyces sp. CBMA29]
MQFPITTPGEPGKGDGVRFRVLGALEGWSGQTRIPFGGPREQRVLALLLLEANRTVSLSHLVDALWDETPPATAGKQIRNAVSRLRSALVAGPGETGDITAVGDAGYRMAVSEGALDSAEFDRQVAAAESARVAGDLAECAELLGAALELWHGPALAGLSGRVIEARAAAWNERRLAVQETYTDHQLALGRHTEVVASLSAIVAEYPLREKPVSQLMLALHRGGRQSEALAAFHGLRTRLADEMGLDVPPALDLLHQRILANDPSVAAPEKPRATEGGPVAAPARVPRQLPAASRHFTGRRRQLKLLDELLDHAVQFGGTAVISAIDGTAGIGKTTLAIHWAQRNAERFPDGQLHVNLRGFAPGSRPLAPVEAIRGFLDALGVPAESVPEELDARAALYRTLLAGRRVLIVLDNARDTDQVRPLLPGSTSCAVVITSRSQLTGLIAAEGATPVTLDLLSAVESLDLLARRLGPERTAAEPEAAAELVELCARLPLALSIAAARALVSPRLSLADLVAALRDVRHRLDTLDIGDASTDLRAVFSWSYGHLSDCTRRMFRLLSVHPGPDITVPAAASLTGVTVTEARRALYDLTRAHLVMEHVPGRFTFHDLLRAYAGELAATHDSEAERRTVLLRVLDHYLHTAHASARLLSPVPIPLTLGDPEPGAVPETLADARRAAEWMEAEEQVLMATVTQADVNGFDVHSDRLGWILMGVSDRRGPNPASPPDPWGPRRSGVHRGLGTSYSWLVAYPAALTHLEHCAGVYRDLDDSTGLAHTYFGLSSVLEHRGRYQEALEYAQQAAELFHVVAHQHGEARARNAAGWLLGRLGDFAASLTQCQQGLALYSVLGDRPMQAVAWDNLGYAHHGLGQYAEAVAAFERSLEITRAAGDLAEEVVTLSYLGDTHHAAGDTAAAAETRRTALTILEGLEPREVAVLREVTHL